MSSSHLRVLRPFLAVIVVAFAFGSARLASADQILTIHNDALTTYKASAKSNIQDVRALVDQRGVDLDGTLRAPSTHDVALAGDPSGERWNGNGRLGGMRLDTGTFLVNDVDLALPAAVPWVFPSP